MIVTKQWLNEYIDILDISTEDICSALNSIGLEVDSVSKISIPKGVVVGKVLEVVKHPDADKLNICQVDIGSKIEQIVCGAKNVAVNQFVPVATVGAVLGEDFKIKKAKLRGVESNGMICSSTEIGLAKVNDGILELDDSIGELIIGKEFSSYPLVNDEIIEIELTANRGDCLSIFGVARELSTYFSLPLAKLDVKIETNNKGIGQVLEVNYDGSCESNLVYKAADITNFSLPLLYTLRVAIVMDLKKTDIERSVNYITHATGVILNVYTKAIATHKDNGMISLNITKDKDGFDIVLGKVPLSTVGIDLGAITDMSDEVIIEASYRSPDELAQKVFDTKKKTADIYYKTSRGSEPNLYFGIDSIITFLSKNGSLIYNGSKDFINNISENIITVNIDTINNIIGQEIGKSKISTILLSLGFELKSSTTDTLTLLIPPFRHDIKNIADITEEIVRIIGIDNIESKPLLIQEISRENKTSIQLELKNHLRTKAIANRFFETVTYVFTNKELLTKYGFDTVADKKDILNPIVNELNTFRTTLALNLVQAVSSNVKQGFKSIAFFEYGTVFDKNRVESKKLSFIFSGYKENEMVHNGAKPLKIEFFDFAQKISNIVGDFTIEPLKNMPNEFIHPYQSGNIILNNTIVGIIYKLHPSVAKDFDIDDDTFIAEIDFDKLSCDTIFAKDISKFQSSKRDLSIVAPKDMQYKKIKSLITKLNIKEIIQFNLIDIYNDKTLGENESLTIKFVLQSDEKTMDEEFINNIMDKIVKELNEKLNINLR